MNPRRRVRLAALAAVSMLAAAAAGSCTQDDPNQLLGPTTGSTSSGASSSGLGGSTTAAASATKAATATAAASTGSGVGGAGGGVGGGQEILDNRVVSYTDALRSASFKLVGDAPPLQDILTLQAAANQQTTYEGMIDAMFADPRFAARMVEFWQNAFHMRQAQPTDPNCTAMTCPQSPSRDEAPFFAARLTVQGGSYTDLLTTTDPTKTCPMYDATQAVAGGDVTQIFADSTGCANTASLGGGTPGTVGILTDPGVMALYFGNFAFRRNRFFHETFICRSAISPAAEPIVPPEVAGDDYGVPGYGSPWNRYSITGDSDPQGAGCEASSPAPCPTDKMNAAVDFQQASPNATICANCHATWNHRAPLWGNFDVNGMYNVPTPMTPFIVPSSAGGLVQATDWLPLGEGTAWKYDVPVATLAALGTAMAADPEVQACAVARMWNFAMSRGDIVETGNTVSPVVTGYTPGMPVTPGSLLAQFQVGNPAMNIPPFQLLSLMKTIFKSADFVRF
jgi:hypothetical protein